MSLIATLRAWRDHRAKRRRERREAEAEAIARGGPWPGDARRADFDKAYRRDGPGAAGDLALDRELVGHRTFIEDNAAGEQS